MLIFYRIITLKNQLEAPYISLSNLTHITKEFARNSKKKKYYPIAFILDGSSEYDSHEYGVKLKFNQFKAAVYISSVSSDLKLSKNITLLFHTV